MLNKLHQQRVRGRHQPNERYWGEMRFDSALSPWCGRMGLGCCSSGLAPLQVLLVAAAGVTHQGMRQDTAGREQEADTETAWKAFSPGPFFSSIHNLAIRAEEDIT